MGQTKITIEEVGSWYVEDNVIFKIIDIVKEHCGRKIE